MRRAFVKALIKLAEKDKRIYLLTADLGYHALEEFAQKFPERFVNCGVAEQNMMGVAAGLALSEKKPYVYSIVPFVTFRCLEQIRNDICYQNLDVKIIGVGGGFSYGTLGSTHVVLEDLAILRALPNINVLSPADLLSTEELIAKSYKTKNPSYIRLSNAGSAKAYEKKPNLQIGKPNVLRDGKDKAIIATGIQVSLCLEAAEELNKKGHDFKILDIHTIKPINKQALLRELRGVKKVFTVEEHGATGGLGSAVAEILAESNWQGTFKIIGTPNEFLSKIGKAEYLRKKYLVDKQGILKNILKFL